MISNPFFLLSIVLSTTLAFFTVAFLIESAIKIFHIRRPRMLAFLRVIPFISLMADPIFECYSLAHWINPLSCKSCLQKLFLESFNPQLKAYLSENKISLLKYLAIDHSHSIFSAIFVAFILLTCAIGSFKLLKALLLARRLRSILANAALYSKPLLNPLLTGALKRAQVDIYASCEVPMPLATYSRAIIIPNEMFENLAPQEFEAVIAHELEHIKTYDPILRLLVQLIAGLFWWVPTHMWIKKIEQDQEIACDQSINKYGIKGESLASALVKVTRHVKSHPAFCYFARNRKPAMERIQMILGINPMKENHLFGLNFMIIVAGLLFLIVCILWL